MDPSRGSTVTQRRGPWTFPTCLSLLLLTGPSSCGALRYQRRLKAHLRVSTQSSVVHKTSRKPLKHGLFLQNNKPLYSFEDNSDYVYDVMWSPTHPALFACVDGVGHLDLWNLNNDTEVPAHTSY